MDRFFRICKRDNWKRKVIHKVLMVHLQFHQLALPLHSMSYSNPSQQGTKASSQPQGHETPPQQGQGQQPESTQAELRKKSC